jgi:hypothetical protein
MEPDEGIGVEPVAADAGPAIDEYELGFGVLRDHGVGEGEPTRP